MALSTRFFATVVALAALAAPLCSLAAQSAAPGGAVPEVLLRLDDVGMNHSVNTAIAKVAATGLPFSVSVMFACPWYQEAVEILKRNPHVAVGVHLVLNSEWRNYRWGPVIGAAGAPSLVDADGYFLPARAEFLARRIDLGEVERELEAQIQRALRSGLRISYVDGHMGTAESTPELRAVMEKLARKHNLGISTWFGERYFTAWGIPVTRKKRDVLAHLDTIKPGVTHLVEIHVAERTPEMDVIVDMNAPSQNMPGQGVAAHRSAELDVVTSPELTALVKAGKIRLVTYRQLIDRAGGIAGMRAPPR